MGWAEESGGGVDLDDIKALEDGACLGLNRAHGELTPSAPSRQSPPPPPTLSLSILLCLYSNPGWPHSSSLFWLAHCSPLLLSMLE